GLMGRLMGSMLQKRITENWERSLEQPDRIANEWRARHTRPRMPEAENPVALVLAGGGARGAYEAGALSVLLPVLDERGQRPRIVLGTSVGALNAAFLAANAHLKPTELIGRALGVWETIRWGEVVEPLI